MFGGFRLGPIVMDLMAKWSPKRKYLHETEYRDDLYDFLNENFYRAGLLSQFPIVKEAGDGVDILIARKIAIEIKKDLTSSAKVDRLIGQIIKYLNSYPMAIIVLVGELNKQALNKLLEQRLRLFNGNLSVARTRVPIILKHHTTIG